MGAPGSAQLPRTKRPSPTKRQILPLCQPCGTGQAPTRGAPATQERARSAQCGWQCDQCLPDTSKLRILVLQFAGPTAHGVLDGLKYRLCWVCTFCSSYCISLTIGCFWGPRREKVCSSEHPRRIPGAPSELGRCFRRLFFSLPGTIFCNFL